MLFHGLSHDIVEKVCQSGLDPRRAGSNAGKLFGSGIYLAEMASKVGACPGWLSTEHYMGTWVHGYMRTPATPRPTPSCLRHVAYSVPATHARVGSRLRAATSAPFIYPPAPHRLDTPSHCTASVYRSPTSTRHQTATANAASWWSVLASASRTWRRRLTET